MSTGESEMTSIVSWHESQIQTRGGFTKHSEDNSRRIVVKGNLANGPLIVHSIDKMSNGTR